MESGRLKRDRSNIGKTDNTFSLQGSPNLQYQTCHVYCSDWCGKCDSGGGNGDRSNLSAWIANTNAENTAYQTAVSAAYLAQANAYSIADAARGNIRADATRSRTKSIAGAQETYMLDLADASKQDLVDAAQNDKVKKDAVADALRRKTIGEDAAGATFGLTEYNAAVALATSDWSINGNAIKKDYEEA